MQIPTITILDGDGFHVWTGTLTQFARDNSRYLAREVICQWRGSLDVNGQLEPAFVGGGAYEHFSVLLNERA